jgi:DNA-binding MarR family transcriptional regulator
MDTAVKLKGCTHLQLRQLSRVVTRHYDRFVAGVGLKNTQYSLLSHIVVLGPVRPTDLARQMRIEASTLTRNLQPLIAQGWVRQSAGDDARSRLIEITDEGRAKRAEGQRAWKQAQLELNRRLGTGRVAELHRLLDEAMGRLDDRDEPGADDA